MSCSKTLTAELAVVTGAASGIGLALTQALLDRGHRVIAIDRQLDGIDPRALARAVDVRDAAGMAQLAAEFAGRPVSHVFANAGISGLPGDVLACADEAWQWAFDVNVIGTLRTLRLWWPHLLAGQGCAVATVSAAALQSFPGAGPYRASKAALLSALEGLYYESVGSGVSMHALCPGVIRSDIGQVMRYPEAVALMTDRAGPPNAFAAHLQRAMATAEPALAFAERVLDGLGQGAPFYGLTHPESLAWIEARHRAVVDGRQPFDDFAGTGAPL